ncbi:hypothetical protein [Microbispora hainanensis]|uniref:hypothetical protein n=1 Tax=Microbispora hainanensis TaxID=568844 RepID=UPI001ABF15F7|nr:hypothetical protein [Microbispora hainanensis]
MPRVVWGAVPRPGLVPGRAVPAGARPPAPVLRPERPGEGRDEGRDEGRGADRRREVPGRRPAIPSTPNTTSTATATPTQIMADSLRLPAPRFARKSTALPGAQGGRGQERASQAARMRASLSGSMP